MANYKFVDADQLDADLITVADAIRSKVQTSASLVFPNEFREAIESISTGVEVKKQSGTFDAFDSTRIDISCGFQPDLVYLYIDLDENYYNFSASLAFGEETREATTDCTTYLYTGLRTAEVHGNLTSDGFSITIYQIVGGTPVHYTAVKYT